MRSSKEIEDSIREDWDETPIKGILPDEMKSRMWMNIEKSTVGRRRKSYRWAAAACVAFLLSIAGYQSLLNLNHPTETVATKTFPQDIRLLRLPDGTRVWVNENTQIEYPKEFAGNVRSVSLKGEAFFEVARDPSKPFIITSGEIKTTVLGTSFNIKAYAGIAPEVNVRTGKVKVEGSKNTVFLERGDGAVLLQQGSAIRKQRSDVLEPGWKKLLLDVDGLTLGQVIEKLQPVHAFAVEYADEGLKNLKIKGTLDARHGLSEMLKTLAFALEVEIKPTGKNTYTISK